MLTFPDVSNFERGLSLSGATACIAKATEGSTFIDAAYGDFHQQALAMGIPFAAYHWINQSDLGGQASNAFRVAQRVPLMVDAEAPGATVDRIVSFVDLYRGLGGTCTMVYYPHWWWQQQGSPSLDPFVHSGLALVSSNYSGSGGWNPYGGMTPSIWQYTATQPFNGYLCDFNRYQGTTDQLRALFNGPTEDEDMMVFVAVVGDQSIYLAPGFAAPSGRQAAYGLTPDAWHAYQALGLKTVTMPNAAALATYYDTAPGPWPNGGLAAHAHELAPVTFDASQTGPVISGH